jgi:glyoxylase-like metal-dependent hydrolase (beta-lactamase superfamily II)
LAGLDFTIGHVPGHTPGSLTFRSNVEDLDALFTGDLLFAGSIGRTDLPGGDHAAILESLARTLTLPDPVIVLPGHGPQTTIGDERQNNPFLTGLKPAQKGL